MLDRFQMPSLPLFNGKAGDTGLLTSVVPRLPISQSQRANASYLAVGVVTKSDLEQGELRKSTVGVLRHPAQLSTDRFGLAQNGSAPP